MGFPVTVKKGIESRSKVENALKHKNVKKKKIKWKLQTCKMKQAKLRIQCKPQRNHRVNHGERKD